MSAGMSATENSRCLVYSCTHAGQAQASRSNTADSSTSSPCTGIEILEEGGSAEDGPWRIFKDEKHREKRGRRSNGRRLSVEGFALSVSLILRYI